MSDPKSHPMTLLFHDGELAEVRNLLGELGTPFVERRGVLLEGDLARGFDLVIATPQRVLDLDLDPAGKRPKLMAVCDADSRSLRNSLSRAGIQWMVRRPVHPAAMRALVLHAIYRGPEKRRNQRVSIGAPIRFRAGWRQRSAILGDLSMGGCRLLTTHPIDPGRSITLMIPAEMAGGKAFTIKARVLRQLPESNEWHTVTAQFDKLRSKQAARLQATIKAHTSGPATFDYQSEPVPESPPEPSPAKVTQGNGERRSTPRRAIDRRVIALGEEATRVLMGRDISIGGMRVNPSPLLVVGQNVRLAIHVENRDVPLVVTAKVHRDDGERGVVLRFHGLEPDCSRTLNQMIDALPVVEPGGPNAGSGMIVSEILAEAQ